MLHVSRPVRWDSDHVTIMDDPTLELFQEIVRCDALDRVHIGLDYFDASINRIGAYVIGTRAAQKCMLRALLKLIATLRCYAAGTRSRMLGRKMSCQPLTILTFSKPATCLNASRKKLVTKAMLAIRPSGTFIFHIQRPPLPYGQFHLHIRSQS